MSPIIPIKTIQAKARSAYYRGVPRDGHEFNWHAKDAIKVWQAEWDHCEHAENCAFFRKQAGIVLAKPAPVVHAASEELSRSLMAMVLP